MVPLETDPLAAVKVTVAMLAGSIAPCARIREVIWPMVTWQVCGEAQPLPCTVAYRTPSRTAYAMVW
jgi:hypothetical protein